MRNVKQDQKDQTLSMEQDEEDQTMSKEQDQEFPMWCKKQDQEDQTKCGNRTGAWSQNRNMVTGLKRGHKAGI